ncbi:MULTISPECIES: hypothetical protein [Idiomarina]|jgi:hypothetical protein|uniref:Uncharacterized protein n=1 Tax=Idiomarina zobellii TaxID=86103 RepID=A0A837NAA5_9GAMM|nr:MULTISPECIES: hypothetical protein [Idiomarina]MBF38468.1 hypothetical protein [Idiomarinaceae bacterium]KPD24522.1 hypothetical protein AFK76_02615 [Idiomarina zobellii]MCH2455935.1 hypothetical protein [Idiomarina sp.]MCJ8315678.1 hypothetical protein [Idiomarina sp.]NQZ15593.1 hypothetical protein [Idiomarina sp.]|tara:strand:+ start:30843 stop:31349 length:507 start_codon:yes stop_codon:yes gene_type:complete
MIADIPTGFDQWQWTQMPVANNTGAKAYFLQNPKIPDWELLKDFYPYCDRNKFDFWLCQIENKNWTFFKGTDDTWVLSKIITTDIEGAKLVGPFFVLSQTEQNGKEVWVYVSHYSLGDVQKILKLKYSQKIRSFRSIEMPNDLWEFKDGLGRLVFSQQGEYVVMVHVI